MALDNRFQLTVPLNQYFVNQTTGLPLAGGKLHFYRDKDRDTRKDVFELVNNGTPPNNDYAYSALPNPVILSNSGTVMNAVGTNVALYLYPYLTTNPSETDLYYVVCTDENDVPQWTREAWPNLTEEQNVNNDDQSLTNQITNPQFSEVFLSENSLGTNYTATNSVVSYPIAPGWFLEIAGPGTIVNVLRVPIAGSDNITTRPAYALQITAGATATTCRLAQYFNNNSGLWASLPGGSANDRYLCPSLVAYSVGSVETINMYYTESTPAPSYPIRIMTGSSGNSAYVRINNSGVKIDESINTATNENTYAKIYIDIPSGKIVRLSSIQLIPSVTDNVYGYDSNSSDRELSLMANYYVPALKRRTAKSLLAGWDFPLNPRQFQNTSIVQVPDYIIDQTIARNHTGTVTYADVDANGRNILSFTNDTADDVLLLGQYMSGKDVKNLIGNNVSMNINAWASVDNVEVFVHLYRGYTASAPPASIPLLSAGDPAGFIIDIDNADADVVFSAGGANWTEISRNGLNTATGTLTQQANLKDNADYGNDLQFTHWEIETDSEIQETDLFCAVVLFKMPTINSFVYVDSISLVQGDVATRPMPLIADETLRQCQAYYNKSYEYNVAAGTATADDMIHGMCGAVASVSGPPNTISILMIMNYEFPEEMVKVPTIEIWDSAATTATPPGHFYMNDGGLDAAITYPGTAARPGWVAGGATTLGQATITNINVTTKFMNQIRFNNQSTNAFDTWTPPAHGSNIYIHYTADARPGK
jgi:hypothetical protein